ncbi:hypothetical protein [Facklamia lactis]|uniref:hypothetical protein n=1 Tax=Facklamia lactis TaxID=2749967 RepID=UPI0018CE8201|nr:hypothetical protein [Facklamia lactis]MBG9979602.1 hypothetical protein [Facklamia lactis]
MDKQITITRYSSDSEEDLDTYSAKEINQGIDKVEVYWWGVRVWISGPTLKTIGAGVSIGGIYIPGTPLHKLNFWGASFQ